MQTLVLRSSIAGIVFGAMWAVFANFEPGRAPSPAAQAAPGQRVATVATQSASPRRSEPSPVTPATIQARKVKIDGSTYTLYPHPSLPNMWVNSTDCQHGTVRLTATKETVTPIEFRQVLGADGNLHWEPYQGTPYDVWGAVLLVETAGVMHSRTVFWDATTMFPLGGWSATSTSGPVKQATLYGGGSRDHRLDGRTNWPQSAEILD